MKTRAKPILWSLIIIVMIKNGGAVSCYDCRVDDGTCNVGECQGASCVKMETSNIDNGRKTVYKSCSDEYEETQCKQSGFGSKLITRCTCESNYCNGDKYLEEYGLQNFANTYRFFDGIVFKFVLIILNTLPIALEIGYL